MAETSQAIPETDVSSSSSEKKPRSSKFTISFDHKWTRWTIIVLTLLVILLLLQLTGTNKVIFKVLLSFIPLGLALGMILLLNPFVNRLVKWKFNRAVARYLTFFISLIIGICLISLLLWLFIDQFSRFIIRFIGDSSLIKGRLLSWEDPTDKNKSLLVYIFNFRYDPEYKEFILQTNVEWDTTLKTTWESYLRLLAGKFASEKKMEWAALEELLRNRFGIINKSSGSTDSYIVDYLRHLRINPSLLSIKNYFDELFNEVTVWIHKNGLAFPSDIKTVLIDKTAIDIAMQGFKIDADKLGAMYQLLFTFAATSQALFSITFLSDIIKTIHNYTSVDNLTNIFINQYFWVLASILYGLFITIMIVLFLLGKNDSYMKFVRNSVLPGKDIVKKEKIANALQRSLFGYGKGILIDMAYMFISTTTVIIFAGFVGGGATYKSSFAVLGLFMTICNVIPYVGPFIGGVPIALVGVLDAVVSPAGTEDFLSWVPMIIAVVGSFGVQVLENTVVYPKIFSRVTSLHPVTILMSISIFAAFFGIWGMIIAVPTVATFKAIANEVYNKQLVL